MRVTYLVSDLGGGAGHHLLDLLRSRDPGLWDAQVLSEVASTSRMSLPVPHEHLPEPTGTRSYPLRQIFRYRQLAARFRQSDPGILHTYFFWSVLYGRLLKARGLVARLVENRDDLGFNWGRHEYAWLAATRHLPDRVICVCEAVRAVVVEREGLSEGKVRVIRNGIIPGSGRHDDAAARQSLRSELGLGPADRVVGMVANFDRPVKGAADFVEMIPHVVRRVPTARFLLVGEGRSTPALRARAQELGVAERLSFTGFRADVERIYELMDASVLTSHSEGLSITILESMRAGVPVVATDVGGNRELVLPGKTGLIVPPRRPDLAGSAVAELLLHPARSRGWGREAQARVRRSFDMRTVAAAYGSLYRELT